VPVRGSRRRRCDARYEAGPPPPEHVHVVYFATHGLVAGDVAGLAEPSRSRFQSSRPSLTTGF
jgi:hypothetical protein